MSNGFPMSYCKHRKTKHISNSPGRGLRHRATAPAGQRPTHARTTRPHRSATRRSTDKRANGSTTAGQPDSQSPTEPAKTCLSGARALARSRAGGDGLRVASACRLGEFQRGEASDLAACLSIGSGEVCRCVKVLPRRISKQDPPSPFPLLRII